MNGHRTCIICLPRTGSQLCEKLAGEINNAYMLGEFFENWNGDSQYEIDINNNIYMKEFVLKPSPFKLTNGLKERLDILKKTDPKQALTLRIFLMNHYDKLELSNLIIELKNMGFEFITLERNLKDQIISYMLACTHNMFDINSTINDPIKVNISKLYTTLRQISDSNIHWGNNVDAILGNISYKKIRYETIYSDMEEAYDRKFKYSGVKTLKGDPFDLIINKEEVMVFLNILLKK